MKKSIPLLFVIAMVSCTTTKSTKASDYWNQPADLSKIVYEGGDGKSLENAVIIKNAENEINGVASEYAYISKGYGKKFTDWKPVGQSTQTIDNKKIDLIMVSIIAKQQTDTIYFDITDFYGKF